MSAGSKVDHVTCEIAVWLPSRRRRWCPLQNLPTVQMRLSSEHRRTSCAALANCVRSPISLPYGLFHVAEQEHVEPFLLDPEVQIRLPLKGERRQYVVIPDQPFPTTTSKASCSASLPSRPLSRAHLISSRTSAGTTRCSSVSPQSEQPANAGSHISACSRVVPLCRGSAPRHWPTTPCGHSHAVASWRGPLAHGPC